MDYGFVQYKTAEVMRTTKCGKIARPVVRNLLKREYASMIKSGPSPLAELKLESRRERRANAKANKIKFYPQLNN